jgi:hypothetical protein
MVVLYRCSTHHALDPGGRALLCCEQWRPCVVRVLDVRGLLASKRQRY